MTQLFKSSVNKLLRKTGYEVNRLRKDEQYPEVNSASETKEEHSPFQWLIDRNIKTVLDIGANTGQFAQQIHELIPSARIVSFEPLADCFDELKRNGEKLGNFEAYNYAIGNSNGVVPIYRSEFSPSSSLRPMGALHKAAFPFTKKGSVEKIKVRRLDAFKGLNVISPALIKIDVQGFEDQVIDGGKKTIAKAQVLIVETSFQTLYEGQPMFDDIYRRLKKLGFEYRGNWFQDNDIRNGSALQADAIFIKSGA